MDVLIAASLLRLLDLKLGDRLPSWSEHEHRSVVSWIRHMIHSLKKMGSFLVKVGNDLVLAFEALLGASLTNPQVPGKERYRQIGRGCLKKMELTSPILVEKII